MRYYHIACPKCGKLQKLEWANFKWEKNSEGEIDIVIENGKLKYDPTYYECNNPECGYHMHEYEKHEFMLEEGYGGRAKWIPSKEPDRPNIRSYHINALYGFRPWVDIAIQWRDAQDDRGKLQDFVNDVLGETYAEDVDKPEPHFLMSRAEDWTIGHIPESVKLLTLGADIQGDRIEAGIQGWNTNNETWILDYKVLPGNPENQESDCWKRLDDMITKEYVRADGEILNVLVSFIDAGYLESRVMGFCDQYMYNKHQIKGVYPIVGKKKRREDAFWKAYRCDINQPRIELNDQKLKWHVYGNLKRKGFYENGFPKWYMHTPADLNEDWYKQLVSEEIISEKDKYGIEQLLIVNSKQRRNEALDICKMNLGALYFVYLRHFEIKNEIRKRKRLKEVDVDWQDFWSLFE
jgi:phage terminase large subunit GpA-like protein